MSDKSALRTQRKQLLLARSSLARLKIQHQLHDVKESMSWTRIGIKAVTSLPVRSALFGLAISRLGDNRVAQLISLASKVILFAKMTGVAIDVKNKFAADAASDSASPTPSSSPATPAAASRAAQ